MPDDIDHPVEPLPVADTGIEYHINGVSLQGKVEVNVALGGLSQFRTYGWSNPDLDEVIGNCPVFGLTISIHNASRRTISSSEFQIALVLPDGFVPSSVGSVLSANKLPDGTWLFNVKSPGTGILFIESWHSVPVEIASKYGEGEVEFILRCFTEFGVRDFPFTVKIGP